MSKAPRPRKRSDDLVFSVDLAGKKKFDEALERTRVALRRIIRETHKVNMRDVLERYMTALSKDFDKLHIDSLPYYGTSLGCCVYEESKPLCLYWLLTQICSGLQFMYTRYKNGANLDSFDLCLSPFIRQLEAIATKGYAASCVERQSGDAERHYRPTFNMTTRGLSTYEVETVRQPFFYRTQTTRS